MKSEDKSAHNVTTTQNMKEYRIASSYDSKTIARESGGSNSRISFMDLRAISIIYHFNRLINIFI
jgi:hypothetical protein